VNSTTQDLITTEPHVITNEDYHKLPGVSASRLKTYIGKYREEYQPRDYWYQYLSGQYVEKPEEHFDFGNAVHEVLLLGENRCKLIPVEVLSSNGARSGNKWKEWKQANIQFILLKQHDYDAVMRCVDVVREHPLAGRMLDAPGVSEKSFFHKFAEYPFDMRMRPDRILTEDNIVVDIKTYAGGTSFTRIIASFGYDIQEAFYRLVADGVGLDIDRFFFIFVRDTLPHPVDVVEVNRDWINATLESIDNALSDLARRYIENDWQPTDFDKPTKVFKPKYLRIE
jgi:exodeoxyribonuclease VIII